MSLMTTFSWIFVMCIFSKIWSRFLTCVKNPERPTCIDVILTNLYRSFQNSCAIETRLSHFHKMIVTILKIYFQNKETKIMQCRDYKNFDEEYREFHVNLVFDHDQCPSYDIFLRKCIYDFYKNFVFLSKILFFK